MDALKLAIVKFKLPLALLKVISALVEAEPMPFVSNPDLITVLERVLMSNPLAPVLLDAKEIGYCVADIVVLNTLHNKTSD